MLACTKTLCSLQACMWDLHPTVASARRLLGAHKPECELEYVFLLCSLLTGLSPGRTHNKVDHANAHHCFEDLQHHSFERTLAAGEVPMLLLPAVQAHLIVQGKGAFLGGTERCQVLQQIGGR